MVNILLATEAAKDTSSCMDPRPWTTYPSHIAQGPRKRGGEVNADMETGRGKDPPAALRGMTGYTTFSQCSKCGCTNLGMFKKKRGSPMDTTKLYL